MPFLSELVVQQVGDHDWRVLQPFRYEGSRERFEVPVDAVTDFASVPKPFQWLIPKSGRYTKATVLHDHLWRHGKKLKVSRSDADGIFRRAMSELGVPFLRRWVMWAAVRLASLARSRLRDGPRDIPQLLLLVVFPGLFVVAGGIVMLLLLLGFFVLELAAAAVMWLLRRPTPVRERTKPVNPPTVSWTA
jgi:Protein of unknown function (DUF1353)